MAQELCDPLEWIDRPLLHDLASVQERIPQRHEMGLLQGIVHHDPDKRLAIGIHDSRTSDFWVRGHIPGRPIMPGVVMVEIAAQLCAWVSSFEIPTEKDKMFGFGGINRTRFRGQVAPGQRVLVASCITRLRQRMATFTTQEWADGQLVFQGEIIGVIL